MSVAPTTESSANGTTPVHLKPPTLRSSMEATAQVSHAEMYLADLFKAVNALLARSVAAQA